MWESEHFVIELSNKVKQWTSFRNYTIKNNNLEEIKNKKQRNQFYHNGKHKKRKIDEQNLTKLIG